MADFTQLTPVELAKLLAQAYAADHHLPGAHLTDPVLRHKLADVLDTDLQRKGAILDVWLQQFEGKERQALKWLDGTFLTILD